MFAFFGMIGFLALLCTVCLLILLMEGESILVNHLIGKGQIQNPSSKMIGVYDEDNQYSF